MNHLREQWAAVVEASMDTPNVGFPEGFVFEPPLYRSMLSPGQKVKIKHPDLDAEIEGVVTGEIPTAGIMVVKLPGMAEGSVIHVPVSMVKTASKIPVYRGITIGWMDEDEAINMNGAALRAVVDRVREPVGHHWSIHWIEAMRHAMGRATLGNTNAEQEMEEGNAFVGVIFHGQVDEADRLTPNDPEWQAINQSQPIFAHDLEGEVTVRGGATIQVRSAEVTVFGADGEDTFEVDFAKSVTARSKTAGLLEDAVRVGQEWLASVGNDTDLSGMCGHATRVISDEVPGVKWAFGEYRESAENVSDHAWNVLPDGTIVDATHSQFWSTERKVLVVPPGDPRQAFYRAEKTGQSPAKMPKTMREVYGAAKTAVAGVTPEQLAFMNRVRAECQQTFGDAMVCREVTKALHDEFGWEVESGYYHGPGHDIRPTHGAFPGHRYIRQPDGSILDVTHDQYEPGMPLLVIPPGDPRQEWYQKIEKQASTWRGFSGEGRTIWNEHDVVILSQRRGRERYFETYIEGQNFRNFPRLDEAKAGVEAKLGPLNWKQEKMDRVWVEHYYFGWTPEFTDPLFVYYADLHLA